MVIRLPLAERPGQKSTGCALKSTEHDIKSTEHDILTTLGDTFTTLCARREFRLTSNRLRFFDFANSCGLANPKPSDERGEFPFVEATQQAGIL